MSNNVPVKDAIMRVLENNANLLFCLAIGLFLTQPLAAQQTTCGFVREFRQKDEKGTVLVDVFRGAEQPAFGGQRPYAFIVPNMKVNTDGTRISYNVDDPRGQNRAINNIRNAFNNPARPISDFEAIRDANWIPVAKTWQVLSPSIIERDKRPGREGRLCIDAKGYLVSMTSDVAVDGGFNRVGDCDQSKWIDALTVPALVIPKNSPFLTNGAGKRNIVIAMSLGQPRRIALGIVGDVGPANEIGEASVEMNRLLNGLPAGEVPKDREDAKARFQAGRTLVMVLPGAVNRVARPITGETVTAAARAKFEAWGGQARLEGCLGELN